MFVSVYSYIIYFSVLELYNIIVKLRLINYSLRYVFFKFIFIKVVDILIRLKIYLYKELKILKCILVISAFYLLIKAKYIYLYYYKFILKIGSS
ncbi:MAG: hypothetical protein Q9162_004196 [Coniocarpon cinnabarinum]